MIRVYAYSGGRLTAQQLGIDDPWPEGVVWVDLLHFDSAEEAAVGAQLGVQLPSREDMHEIEESSRLYHENEATFMTATLVTNADSPRPESAAVTFVLAGGCLITLRDAEPTPFRSFVAQAERHPQVCADAATTLTGLLEAVVDRLADILEMAQADLDGASREIFADGSQRKGGDLKRLLGRIGRNGDLVSKARESLVTLARIQTFSRQLDALQNRKSIQTRLKTLGQDLASISDHAGFLNNKVNFLLDATLGLISMEQNAIIKTFSMVAVVFLPPTLIASIYGMNFAHMPELDWPFGYPLALLVMLASAILPLMFFKRRGWL